MEVLRCPRVSHGVNKGKPHSGFWMRRNCRYVRAVNKYKPRLGLCRKQVRFKKACYRVEMLSYNLLIDFFLGVKVPMLDSNLADLFAMLGVGEYI